jgi:hypothetical protein
LDLVARHQILKGIEIVCEYLFGEMGITWILGTLGALNLFHAWDEFCLRSAGKE